MITSRLESFSDSLVRPKFHYGQLVKVIDTDYRDRNLFGTISSIERRTVANYDKSYYVYRVDIVSGSLKYSQDKFVFISEDKLQDWEQLYTEPEPWGSKAPKLHDILVIDENQSELKIT